jgi:hypothetical protein
MGIQCSAAIRCRWFSRKHPGGDDGGDVHFAIVLPNRTTLRATREAGLVQIANDSPRTGRR